jgi:hypothetical protein
MNPIFATVFLAACVAAHTTFGTTDDLSKFLLKSKLQHNFNKYDQLSVADLFRSNGLWGKYDRVATPWVLPRSYYPNVDDVNTFVDPTTDVTTVLTLEELVHHPLFREYLTLPLFRQHLSHPLFQYYLTTPLFQKYWILPEFKTFFVNPYLFYKYVYPVVYNTESHVFDQVKTDSLYPYNQWKTAGVYNTDLVTDRDVLDKYYGQRVNTGLVDKLFNKYEIPSTIYGQQYNGIFRHHLPYTYTMDKMFKHYLVNKPVTEVVTDVKVFPDQDVEEETYKKVVDPITGEIKYIKGDFNVVDEKVIPFIGEDKKIDIEDILNKRPIMDMDTLFGGRKHLNVKDTLLKRLYMNKVLYGDRKFDEVYPEISNLDILKEKEQLPLFDKLEKLNKIEKLNKLNRFEKFDNIFDVEKFNNGVNDMNMNIEDIYRPTFDSILKNKDLLTRVPLTKEQQMLKDFTMNKYNKYEMPTTFKTISEKKTVIV